MGKRNSPFYRIVVADARRSRDGKYLETVGHYNPKNKNLVFKKERVEYWLSKGAKTTDSAKRLWDRFLKTLISPELITTSGERESDRSQGERAPEVKGGEDERAD